MVLSTVELAAHEVDVSLIGTVPHWSGVAVREELGDAEQREGAEAEDREEGREALGPRCVTMPLSRRTK